jgi:hypothetical protein
VARAFSLSTRVEDSAKRAAVADPQWREMWESSRPLDGSLNLLYLEGRGISSDVAHEAGVRFSSEWYGRPSVLFPMYDKVGNLIAVNGRFIDGRDNPKTQTAGPKSLGVFSTPGALSAPLVAICEGVMDALSLWLCGIASAALVGTSGPEWLPSALAFRSVLIATDADPSGDEAAAKLQPALMSRGARTFRLRPRGGKDWSELLEERGADALRTHLAAFSETADEETRFDTAWQLMQNGRADAAHFIVSLVEDAFTREMMRVGLGRACRAAVNSSECVA